MSQANRLGDTISNARFDLYESRFFCKGSERRTRIEAKRAARKARRRLNRIAARLDELSEEEF